MKYRIFGVIACILTILLSVTVVAFTESSSNRVHQHMEEKEIIECTHNSSVFCTHLPLVQIETGGETIPGRAILDEYKRTIGYEKTPEGADSIQAAIKVTDNPKNNNHLTDDPQVISDIIINVRGNSSRRFDKPSYAIGLIDENGENNSQSIMGMDEHHEWVLHGPFLDKTLIRNYMWYNIGGEIMDYAPNVRFCEVFVDGEYQGVYVMAESVTAGTNGARLNLSVDNKDNEFFGYLLRLDLGSATEIKNINQFTNYTHRALTRMNIEYPGTSNLTEEMRDAITQDFSDFEKMLYSYDYDSSKYGYEHYIDTDSFVDFYIINEFTCNYDAGWLSTFIYKEMNSKYRLCIWDFNSACDNYQDSMRNPEHFEVQNCLWYVMLMKDEAFVDRIISRYYELRKTYLSDEYLDAYIDDTVAYLGDAIDRNYEKWGYSFEEEYDLLKPTERNPRSYEEAVAAMKQFLRERSRWMDDNIEVIRQYCVESKVKKFNENAN